MVDHKQIADELSRSCDEWQLIFDLLSDGISILDQEYNILHSNLAFRRMLPDGHAIGGKCYQLVHGLDQPPSYCPLAKALVSKSSESYEFFEPWLGRYLSIRVNQVFSASGDVIGAIHIVSELT